MSTAAARKKLTSAALRKTLGGCAILTGCGTVGAYTYYKVSWLPAYKEELRRKLERPPERTTRLYVAGTRDGEGLLPEIRTMPAPVFFVYAAYRAVLLFVRCVPVVWFGLLMWMKLCPENVFYMKFRDFLSSMGPSYIKLGQWMATRPDFFPDGMCSVLEQLYDHTVSHSWSHTEKLLRAKLKDGPYAQQSALRLVSEIEKEPINSGSIAQVHRAKLRESVDGVPAGTELVIKVCHPHIHEQVAADIAAMKLFVSIGNLVIPGVRLLHLEASVREFSSLIRSQLNLMVECDNLQQFRYNFRGVNGVVFPVTLPSVSNAHMLFETFEEGEPLQNVQCSYDNDDIADIGCHMFLKMLFEDNFVHSDLHPGNIFLRVNNVGKKKEYYPDGKEKLKREIVVLDAGLVTTLSPSERDNFISLFAAVACGDGELGADLMVDRLPSDMKGGLSAVNRDRFRKDMSEIFSLVSPEKDGFKLSNIKIGDILGKVMRAVRENNTPLDGNFASLVLTVMVGEGLGRKLVPEYNIFAEAVPFLLAYLQDNELLFLASKLRDTYGAASLLRGSVDLVKPKKAPTYWSIAKQMTTYQVDRFLRWTNQVDEEDVETFLSRS